MRTRYSVPALARACAMAVWAMLVPFGTGLVHGKPALTPGVWTNITPEAAGVDPDSAHIFCQGMAIDPNDPNTLYLCICGYDVAKPVGLYKTTDAGSTWKRVGKLDEPLHVVVDPGNSRHLYAVDGVRGNTLGFWVSEDGGESWTKPAGFTAATAAPVGTQDLYSISVEPGDFNHILVSFHSPWAGTSNAGVLESKDGGQSWTAHQPPAGSAGGYGMAVFFLDFPQHGMGDKDTWLFTAQQGGFYRTTDAGAHWSLVYNNPMTHGGNQIYCTKSGVLYSGGYQYPARSSDNGASWAQVKTGLDYSWYMGVAGDGNYLYIGNTGDDRPFFVSPETDGTVWTQYQGGAQKFNSEPFEMHYDSANGIMYSSNWEGLYALKVLEPGAAIMPAPRSGRRNGASLSPVRNGILADDGAGRRYTLPGRRLPPE